MHTIRSGKVTVGKKLSHAFVGEQHGLLDQAGGGAALARDDVDRQAGVIQKHVDLGRLEVDRPALAADLPPSARQRICVLKELNEVDAALTGSVGGFGSAPQGRLIRVPILFRRTNRATRVADMPHGTLIRALCLASVLAHHIDGSV